MASTAPAKSQPLHNFTLPHHLKWNKDGQSGGSGGGLHHRRRSIKSPSRRPNASSASPVRHSPLRDSVSATPPRHQSPPRETPYYAGKQPSPPAPFSGKRSAISGDLPPHHIRRHDSSVDYQRIHPKTDGSRTTIAVPSTNPERTPNQAKSKGKEIEASGSKKSKILIKIPCKSTTTRTEEVPVPVPIPIQVPTPIPAAKIENKVEADENMDEETKVWNLRPRKPIRRFVSGSGGGGGGGGCPVRNNGSEKNKGESKSGETSQKKGGGGGEKEKKKVSIFLSLTKEEIEEDIFSLTGSKPARRPKKRPKNVQRQVDTLFPGSWLVSINADSYKVSENSLKG